MDKLTAPRLKMLQSYYEEGSEVWQAFSMALSSLAPAGEVCECAMNEQVIVGLRAEVAALQSKLAEAEARVAELMEDAAGRRQKELERQQATPAPDRDAVREGKGKQYTGTAEDAFFYLGLISCDLGLDKDTPEAIVAADPEVCWRKVVKLLRTLDWERERVKKAEGMCIKLKRELKALTPSHPSAGRDEVREAGELIIDLALEQCDVAPDYTSTDMKAAVKAYRQALATPQGKGDVS